MHLKDSLRKAVSECDLSILQISKRADVPYQAAHGFIRAGRDIRLSTATKLAELVGVELRPKAKRSNRKSR